MAGASISGADPDGLGWLAVELERAIADLDAQQRRLTRAALAAVPMSSLVSLGAVIEWLRRQSGDVRRRAVVAAAAGKGWHHPSLRDHLFTLGRAAVRGLRDGVVQLAVGGRTAVELSWYTYTGHPVRAAKVGAHSWANIARSLETVDPMHVGLAVTYVRRLPTEGLWPATEDYVHDNYATVPSAALSAAGAVGVGGVLAEVASDASYVSVLAPAGASGIGRGRVPEVLRLSVPAADGTSRVALDPADGRFVVFTAADGGVTTHKTRWDGLDHEEKAALEDAGIVDHKGHLRDD